MARATSSLAKTALRAINPHKACTRCLATSSRLSQDAPQMPACDFEPKPYKGLPYEELLAKRKKHVTPALLTYYRKPVLLHQGHMQYVWDQSGKRYLDLIGGMITISAGHCHPKIIEALNEQANTLWHTSSIWMNSQLPEYAEKLANTLPGDLNVVYFCNSGSEANDLAIMMSRLHTGAYDIIGLRSGYHGGSPTVMGLTAMQTWRFKMPGSFGIHHTVNPDPYRGPWGGANCRDSPVQTDRTCNCKVGECYAGDMYIDQLEDILKHCTPHDGVAGFFAEAIQGGGGTIQFPRNYLKKAFEMVREKGGLCISDESFLGFLGKPAVAGPVPATADFVQTAFGRTGTHFWGFEGHGVLPDIVTTAKGIGNGFPLAAVITTPEVAKSMTRALHFNTFGGNPLAMAVGSKVLDVLEEEKLQENCHVVGTYILEKLAALRDEFKIIGDVRGKGLLIGIELVEDKETRKPIKPEIYGDIWEALKDHGLLVGKGGLNQNVYRIKPPMCITKEDADFLVATFRKVFSEHWSNN